MDFSFNEEQDDLKGLVEKILEGELTSERLKEVEAGDDNFDRDLWAKLADAGLLGIAIPEAHGGGGYGFLEVALVLEQVGRTVAPVPYYESVVLGALPIAMNVRRSRRGVMTRPRSATPAAAGVDRTTSGSDRSCWRPPRHPGCGS